MPQNINVVSVTPGFSAIRANRQADKYERDMMRQRGGQPIQIFDPGLLMAMLQSQINEQQFAQSMAYNREAGEADRTLRREEMADLRDQVGKSLGLQRDQFSEMVRQAKEAREDSAAATTEARNAMIFSRTGQRGEAALRSGEEDALASVKRALDPEAQAATVAGTFSRPAIIGAARSTANIRDDAGTKDATAVTSAVDALAKDIERSFFRFHGSGGQLSIGETAGMAASLQTAEELRAQIESLPENKRALFAPAMDRLRVIQESMAPVAPMLAGGVQGRATEAGNAIADWRRQAGSEQQGAMDSMFDAMMGGASSTDVARMGGAVSAAGQYSSTPIDTGTGQDLEAAVARLMGSYPGAAGAAKIASGPSPAVADALASRADAKSGLNDAASKQLLAMLSTGKDARELMAAGMPTQAAIRSGQGLMEGIGNAADTVGAIPWDAAIDAMINGATMNMGYNPMGIVGAGMSGGAGQNLAAEMAARGYSTGAPVPGGLQQNTGRGPMSIFDWLRSGQTQR